MYILAWHYIFICKVLLVLFCIADGAFSNFHDFVGVYSLDIFAAPVNREGTSLDAVWTYITYVPKANPELVPFPKVHNAWNENGCQMDGLTNGDVEAENNQLINILAPGASNVAVVTADNQQTQLQKVSRLNCAIHVNKCVHIVLWAKSWNIQYVFDGSVRVGWRREVGGRGEQWCSG